MPGENTPGEETTGDDESPVNNTDRGVEKGELTLREVMTSRIVDGKYPEDIDIREELKKALKEQEEKDFLRAVLTVVLAWTCIVVLFSLLDIAPDLVPVFAFSVIVSLLFVVMLLIRNRLLGSGGKSGKPERIEITHRKL